MKLYNNIQYNAAVKYLERNTLKIKMDTSKALFVAVIASIAGLILTIVSIYTSR